MLVTKSDKLFDRVVNQTRLYAKGREGYIPTILHDGIEVALQQAGCPEVGELYAPCVTRVARHIIRQLE